MPTRNRFRYYCMIVTFVSVAGMTLSCIVPSAFAQDQAAAGAASAQNDYWPSDWPRDFKDADGNEFTFYEPQLESWNGHLLSARVAVAAKAYTGQYAAGKRVATTNPDGGGVVAGRGVTRNPYTGNYSETSYVRGRQGAIAKHVNNTYVDSDNNIYKKDSSGQWSHYYSASGFGGFLGGGFHGGGFRGGFRR